MAQTRVAAASLLVMCLTASLVVSSNAQLKYGYYKNSCPNAESIITQTVRSAWEADKSIIAGLIRLMFHDCFVRGCEASVLLDGPNSEKTGAPNANSLRGFEVIDAAKAALEAACPATVSCADILVYAARDSIILGGGVSLPGFWVGGRKDGNVSNASETLTNLPAPFFTLPQLTSAFASKGFSQNEMVTLSGGHTVGIAHCGVILSRLYNFAGTGQPDPSIDPTYLPTLQAACPSTSPGKTINMEMATPAIVDSRYFKDVRKGRGLFTSDDNLRNSSNTATRLLLDEVNRIFVPDFSWAMVKMSKIQVLTGKAGKIRVQCNTTDGAV